jgi:hypothetical protein
LEKTLRIIINTETKLTTVDGYTDFKRLDAVIIGEGTVPDYIGSLDDAHIWIFRGIIEQLLDLQSDADRNAFCDLIDFARLKGWLHQTESGEKIRVHIVERIGAKPES